MTDPLQERIAKAIDGAARPITPTEAMRAEVAPMWSLLRSRRRQLVSAAVLLVAVLVSAVLWMLAGYRSSTVNTTPAAGQGPTSGNVVSPSTTLPKGATESAAMAAHYESLASQVPPGDPGLPPLVAPVRLPAGWEHLAGLTSSVSSTESSISIDFVKPHDGPEAYPAITVCITLDSTCSPTEDDVNLEPVPVQVDGFAGQVVLYGEPAALRDWQGIAWTTDIESVDW